MDKKTVLEVAITTGERLLANGCSTHRVEGVVRKVLNARALTKSEVFITTSGIVVTIESETTGVMTMVKKVPKKSMHLEKISHIEEIVNDFVTKKISAEIALDRLEETKKIVTYPLFVTVLAFCGAGFFRTLMFGGNFSDALASFLVGICLGIIIQTLNSRNIIGFLVTVCGGFTVGFTSILLLRYGIGVQLDKIIVGSLIAIAPGVPFAHAVNDILNGEQISGNIRAMEALTNGIALASGSAIAVQFWTYLSGGIIK